MHTWKHRQMHAHLNTTQTQKNMYNEDGNILRNCHLGCLGADLRGAPLTTA